MITEECLVLYIPFIHQKSILDFELSSLGSNESTPPPLDCRLRTSTKDAPAEPKHLAGYFTASFSCRLCRIVVYKTADGGKTVMTWRNKSSRKFKSEQRGDTKGDAGKSSLQSKMPRSQPRNRMDHDGARGLSVRHVLLCASVLCMYIYTALPSVPGGDSGELLAEACHGGIPHPPGYPLLNVLHNILSRLVHSAVIVLPWPKPPGIVEIGATCKVAFAANILAGVFGAGTSVMICLAVEEWTHGSREAYSPGAAIGVALLFSFSPLAWEYSTGTEVFALNNFLVATAMYLTARSVKRPSMNIARVGATVRESHPLTGRVPSVMAIQTYIHT